MIDDISAILKGISTAAETAVVLRELLEKQKGDAIVFLEEFEENLNLCWLVVEEGTDPARVIPEFKTSEFSRLRKESFKFNSINRKKIRSSITLEASDLAFLIGKKMEFLVKNIYKKIKQLQQAYRVDKENQKIRWRMRIENLHRRMLLLTKHLKSK